jgi:hypothetical protein
MRVCVFVRRDRFRRDRSRLTVLCVYVCMCVYVCVSLRVCVCVCVYNLNIWYYIIYVICV